MKKRILVVDDSSTIRKVVAGILERHGYEAVVAADAQAGLQAVSGEALAGTPFDLALLDFVMPKMNGLQFCRELRQTPVGQELPIVLMSAKSDKIRDKFVFQTGAVDAITKPFDAQALVTVIQHALARVEDGRVPESVAVEPGGEHPSSPPPTLQEPDVGPMLSGNLSGVPIGAVLQLLQMEALSGVLVVEGGPIEVRIVVTHGLVDRVFAHGTRSEFRLGRFFVEEGLVTPDELERLMRAAARLSSPDDKRDESGAPRRPRLGDVLLQSGKVTRAQLVTALTKQSSELIYQVLRWQSGRFEMFKNLSERDDPEPRLALPVASVVMEGFRRVDEWRLIEAKLGSFDEVLVPDPVAIATLGEDKMTKHEKSVLAAIGRERTLREIVAESHLSSFDACKIVCQFLEARLVRRRAAA